MKSSILRILAFGTPVLIGALLLYSAIANRPPPEQKPISEQARAARVMTVEPKPFTPRASGFGEVQPARVWEAVAQVAGPIEFVSPDLQAGKIISRGTEIIRISRDQYEIALQQARADLSVAQAKLGELEAQVANTTASLAIEEKSLALKQDDLNRKQALLGRRTTSQAAVDTSEIALLTQQARVQEQQNAIRLTRSQIESQRSQIAASKSRIQQAELDLARTRIAMPFTARIASESVEATQFVGVGTKMVAADGIDVAEVRAKIPQDAFAGFLKLAMPDSDLQLTGADGRRRPRLNAKDLGWRAEVQLDFNGRTVRWPAEVVRTADTIDQETRTVGVIVSVQNPYSASRPGLQPPLVKGMFVNIVIKGRPIDGSLVVPRASVRDGNVFVMDDDKRLRRRAVEVASEQGEVAVIANGLAAGDIVVLSDVAPAIDGMLLDPQPVHGERPKAGAVSPGANSKAKAAGKDDAPADPTQGGAVQ
ncbi:MAG: efflux RND transporter periplasmic adaptor subunit [Pseudomonadota bacterium]